MFSWGFTSKAPGHPLEADVFVSIACSGVCFPLRQLGGCISQLPSSQYLYFILYGALTSSSSFFMVVRDLPPYSSIPSSEPLIYAEVSYPSFNSHESFCGFSREGHLGKKC